MHNLNIVVRPPYHDTNCRPPQTKWEHSCSWKIRRDPQLGPRGLGIGHEPNIQAQIPSGSFYQNESCMAMEMNGFSNPSSPHL